MGCWPPPAPRRGPTWPPHRSRGNESTVQQRAHSELRALDPAAPDHDQKVATLRRAALQSLLDEEIFVEEAEALGKSIPASDVDHAIDLVKRDNHLDDAQFLLVLTGSGQTLDSYRQMITRQLLAAWVRQVLASGARPAVVSAADQRIRDLMRRATSVPPSIYRAGTVVRTEWLLRGSNELTPAAEQALFAAKVGDGIGPFTAGAGLHAFKVHQFEYDPRSFDAVNSELRQTIFQEELDRRALAWLAEQRLRMKIGVLFYVERDGLDRPDRRCHERNC